MKHPFISGRNELSGGSLRTMLLDLLDCYCGDRRLYGEHPFGIYPSG